MATLALDSAASGLTALNRKLDVIANNLANVNTVGFKSSRVNFEDLLYLERGQPGVENANGDQRPTGIYIGLGTRVSGTQLQFAEGSPIASPNDLDLLIRGNGFFQVQVEDSLGGGIAYTRAGNFAVNGNGEMVLANSQGRRIEPGITIPNDAQTIDIDSNGRVFVLQTGQTQVQQIGQITTATFVNPAGLRQVGENLFIETTASGPPLVGEPGTDNRGTILQRVTESSNVDPTRELIDLIRTQRAFEMNSQTIRAADEVLQQLSQLRR